MADRPGKVLRVAIGALVVGMGVLGLGRGDSDHLSPWSPAGLRPQSSATTSGSGSPSTAPTRSVNPTPSTTPPTPLTVVALGDSVASASTCGCNGYVEQVGAWLQQTTHRTTLVHNDAVDGWTTADLENSLSSDATRSDLAHADLVIIEIGANDLDFGNVDNPACFQDPTAPCWRDAVREMRARLLRIVADIKALDSTSDVRVAVAGYWNVTVDGRVGRALGPNFVTGSEVLTRLVNTTIEDAARDTDSVYVDFYAPLKGKDGSRDPTDDLLDDGDHPNQSGHTLLTRALINTLESTGVVTSWSAG